VKKEATSDVTKRHREERKSMFDIQRSERSALFAVSWRGKGAELNRRRSVMAAKQQSGKLSLRDRQKDERENLKKRFPRQFPSFKRWLALEKDQELSAIFRYPGQPVIFAASGKEPFSGNRQYDLRDYSPVIGGRDGGVMYRRAGSSIADFIDYGRKIVFPEKFDEESVLAALQLAGQKWGAAQISGSEEYKRLCVRLAAKHDIRIVNPELKSEIETARGSERQNYGYGKGGGWSR